MPTITASIAKPSTTCLIFRDLAIVLIEILTVTNDGRRLQGLQFGESTCVWLGDFNVLGDVFVSARAFIDDVVRLLERTVRRKG